MQPAKTALILLLNPLVNDSRVLKECTSLAQAGYRVEVFALYEAPLSEAETTAFGQVRRFKAHAWRSQHKLFKLFKFIEVALRMLGTVEQVKPDIIHANDLETLPIGFVMSRLWGAKLVYDSHELWRDPGHKAGIPGWMFELAMATERFLAPRAHGTITVSESIARDMEEHLRIPLPTLVRNVPMPQREDRPANDHPLRTDLGLAPEVPIVLYQGRLAHGYGVMQLLEAFPNVARPAVLVYLGYGPLREPLEARSQELGLQDRVFFHPAVPPSELLRYSADATVGACPSQGTCTSYRYSLPNKFFEYIQAGLPVVATDLPELATMVRRYDIGDTFPDEDGNALAATLNGLLFDPARLAHHRAAVSRAAAELHWHNEARELVDLYQRLCPVEAAT